MGSPPAEYATQAGASDAEFTLSGTWAYLSGAKGPSGFGSRSTAQQVAASWDGKGKVAIVTGASGGLGAETARVLAGRGCHVVCAVRDVQKTSKLLLSIRKACPSASIEPMQLDLSSLASVRGFAAAFLRRHSRLDILVCNAGTAFTPLRLTPDGYESAFATNHLGHHLLVALLRPLLLSTARASGAPGRVVAVSSEAHRHPYPAAAGGPVRFERLGDTKSFSPLAGYGQSKLCNVLFVRELQARADAAGEPLLAAALHPGVILTEADRHLPWLLRCIGRLLARPLLKSVAQGAATTVWVATAPGVRGGEYYADCNPWPASAATHDAALGRRLWEFSDALVAEQAGRAAALASGGGGPQLAAGA